MPSQRLPLNSQQLSEDLTALLPGARVEIVDELESTNTTLAEYVRGDVRKWPHLSCLIADHQTKGLGRSDRQWEEPHNTSVLLSTVIDPQGVDPQWWSWIPLIAALAVQQCVENYGVQARVKWPNDVLIMGAPDMQGWGSGRKVSGILASVVGDGARVVVGIGINVLQNEDELPVPHATSLRASGVQVSREQVIVDLMGALSSLFDSWDPALIRSRYAHVCSTLGENVVVELPGGEKVQGVATRIDPDGQLLLDVEGQTRKISAGDVSYLRQRP